MKYLIALLITVVTLNAQPNQYYLFLEKNYEQTFDNSIMLHAQYKWGNDLEMVLYEMNSQSEAFINVILFNKNHDIKDTVVNQKIVFRTMELMLKWSYDKWEGTNEKILKKMNQEIDTPGYDALKTFLSVHTDWEMVLNDLKIYWKSYQELYGK